MHHANILINKENIKEFVFDILKNNLNFEVKANPDFLLLESESFGIDDARNLEKWAIGKPLIGDTKIYFIITKSITNEAQNAMLKVLEEPTAGTYFFISLENLGGLLPTFISRVMIWDNLLGEAEKNNEKNKNQAHKFLNSKIKERLAIIKNLVKKENKNEIKDLIKDLENISNKISPNAAKNILTAKIFSSARGSSPKMILEWLSCML